MALASERASPGPPTQAIEITPYEITRREEFLKMFEDVVEEAPPPLLFDEVKEILSKPPDDRSLIEIRRLQEQPYFKNNKFFQ